jgi:hypothetical protein
LTKYYEKKTSLAQSNKRRTVISYIQKNIPEQWVMHEYGPDYGIDFVVELFDYVKDDTSVAETLGEVFFVQLKSSSSIDYTTRRVYSRGNVEKGPLSEDKSEYYDLPVAKFVLDTVEIQTIQAMGPAIPVLLVLVDINSEKAYFVCLNDYIDKVLIPEDQNFGEKDDKTIYIPIANEIGLDEEKLVPLRAYGKRAKMYGAFTKFNYQKKEIERTLGLAAANESLSEESMRFMLHTFVEASLRQDIWESHEFWAPIPASHKDLLEVQKYLPTVTTDDFPKFVSYCYNVWHRLANLNNMYEELVREWFMPTLLSKLCSYPGYEAPVKASKLEKNG